LLSKTTNQGNEVAVQIFVVSFLEVFFVAVRSPGSKRATGLGQAHAFRSEMLNQFMGASFWQSSPQLANQFSSQHVAPPYVFRFARLGTN
jgi:hypothetical protein